MEEGYGTKFSGMFYFYCRCYGHPNRDGRILGLISLSYRFPRFHNLHGVHDLLYAYIYTRERERERNWRFTLGSSNIIQNQKL